MGVCVCVCVFEFEHEYVCMCLCACEYVCVCACHTFAKMWNTQTLFSRWLHTELSALTRDQVYTCSQSAIQLPNRPQCCANTVWVNSCYAVNMPQTAAIGRLCITDSKCDLWPVTSLRKESDQEVATDTNRKWRSLPAIFVRHETGALHCRVNIMLGDLCVTRRKRNDLVHMGFFHTDRLGSE